ncbi:TROVE domain-containing protein [Paenibacillus hunanensis]|uniref:60 kDa SS-A/Ro ribonucleoprotein n=1 Tax=Paenibacillus hunanensis TaxID=539262 RepID=A0ABU1J3R5_9BACL|nr:TROVE domain-containing protein [Paenibacillus hunanensis]MDR6246150.1 60 kDa SS-A/Ro ribonucleoprotein [Paenibacillus hunanensis]GGJ08514.1 60 kDa SS-A/Ro ribonucleoprotein [Paenibacillus hunanensis]
MSQAKKLFDRPTPSISNREGYKAYNRSVEEEYIQLLMTNTFANTFYADSNQLIAEARSMHEMMLELDAEFMARALVFARNEGFMRMQPLFGLALLSKARPDLFAAVFDRVVRIPSDLADFLTILRGMGRGQGGRAVKRQVNRFLAGVSEYWALKYNGRGRGFSLGDVIATAHPKPQNEQQRQLYRYLCGQNADLTGFPQLQALEQLKQAKTDEERLQQIRAGKLPYETVTSTLQPSRRVWIELMQQMPAFALLRHLNALHRQGVFNGTGTHKARKLKTQHIDYIRSRLHDIEALRKAKILPFRFARAYREMELPELRDILAEAVELSFNNLPSMPGRTAIFLDISGSMSGEYLQTGSIFALALYKKTSGNSLFWTFDTLVQDACPSHNESIMKQAERIHARGGTDTGAPVRELIRQKYKVDQIIMITDEQQNTGSPFYRELQTYRHSVNRDAKAFIIDIAPYRSAMTPPEDLNTFYVYGWSDTVLSFIAQASRGFGGMVKTVQQIELEADSL